MELCNYEAQLDDFQRLLQAAREELQLARRRDAQTQTDLRTRLPDFAQDPTAHLSYTMNLNPDQFVHGPINHGMVSN